MVLEVLSVGLMKLDIGAGSDPCGEDEKRRAAGLPHRPDGEWTTVDAFCEADIRAMMWDLPIGDDLVDGIWSSHVLEHLPANRVAETLREWLRVLRPGGTAIIQVPNLDYACRYWLEHQGEPWALMILFGNQHHQGEFHQTGWSRASLWQDLADAGFVVDSIETTWDYGQETLRASVHKQ